MSGKYDVHPLEQKFRDDMEEKRREDALQKELFETVIKDMRECSTKPDGTWTDMALFRSYRRGWTDALYHWAIQPSWQPIETAPKDGTRILGLLIEDGTIVIVRRFDPPLGSGRWLCDDGIETFALTHWMPLPAVNTPR